MSDTNLAADQLKSFVRRIESVEDEINALNSDKSEIFKEAKSNGFDVKQLRKVIQKRRLPADEREEQDTVFDLYWDAVHGAETSLVHAHVENIEEFPAKKALAALKADPLMAIVDAANLKTHSQAKASEDGDALVTGESAPHDSVTGDASSVSDGAETVASISPETPDPVLSTKGMKAPMMVANGASAGGENVAASFDTDTTEQVDTLLDDKGKSVEASAFAAPATPKYAAPGVVTWENHPPEGVERSIYSIAFSNMGQDPVLIQDELANGKAQPIVKQGNVILDGWARYMIARTMREMDGTALSYAVVQYDGSDALLDVICWNVQGRVLTEQQRRAAAQMLSRQPEFKARKAEIYAAMELGMELVA